MTTDIYTQNLLQKRAQEVEQLSLELAEVKANYQLSLTREKNTSELAFKFTQECKEAVERATKVEAELEQLKAFEDYPTFVHYIEGYRERTKEMTRAQEESKRLRYAIKNAFEISRQPYITITVEQWEELNTILNAALEGKEE